MQAALDEPELKRTLARVLRNDFELRPEAQGRSIVDGVGVKADFLARPKAELLRRNFVHGWFAIEVKRIDFETAKSDRLYKAFWQAVSYSQSEFITDEGHVRPTFCALYLGQSPHQRRTRAGEVQYRRWQILTELGVYSNTGYFLGDQPDAWELWFGAASYFKKASGLNAVPRGMKRYVGHASRRITAARAQLGDVGA